MRKSLPTVDEPRFLVLIILVLVMAGLSALYTLGRQEDPTITNIFGTITTRLPGADPARIESLISTELEAEIQEISDVAEIVSLSLKGVSIINITLDETIDKVRIAEVWTQLRNAVDDATARLPAEALTPVIDTEGISAYSTVIGLSLTHPGTTLTAAGRFADHIADQIRSVPNTRAVHLFGAPEEEVLVSVDPIAAAALGMSIPEIAGRISSADGKVLAGQQINDISDMNLAVSGEIEQLDRIRTVPLRENNFGQSVQVEDIATVTRGPTTPSREMALANGMPAILIAALIEDGKQIDRWMSGVREKISAAKQGTPEGLQVDLLFDQSTYTVERLTSVGRSLLMGMGIVVLVLMFTLGWRSAAIVALILPLVSLATLATLSFIGLPLHQMTLTGLIAALGLVVDAAIVMTDTVRRQLAAGLSRAEAARAAVDRLFVPLAASTFTTILAFTPMIILPGPTGDFVSAIAISVAVMLFWSFALAILVTSALSARFLPLPNVPLNERRANPLTGLMTWILRHPTGTLTVSLILPVLGFALAPTLTPQFFPTEARNQFHMEVELPGQSSILRTEELAKRVDLKLQETDGVLSTYWGIGRSAPSFYYNLIGSRSNEAQFAQAMITTQDVAAADRILETIQDDLDRAFPEARIIVRRLAQGPPVDAPVEFRLVGPDIDVLTKTGEAIKAIVDQQDTITHARSSMSLGLPQLRYEIDSFRAQRVGLDEVAIAGQLDAGLSGRIAGSMVEGTEQIPVRVRLNSELRENIPRIGDMPLITVSNLDGDGPPAVLLSSLAEPRLDVAASAVHRKDSERINLIQAFTRAGVLPEQATRQSLAAIENSDIVIPAGYRLELGGDTDERQETVRNLLSTAGLIITLTLATAVLTFRSFRLTVGAVLVSVLSAGLAMLALAFMQFPFGVNALIGVIGSIGVSINAAIIIFTALQENEAAAHGDRAAGAAEVLGAGRHIISTTLTTFGGFIPLILADGLFWPPFAAAVAGGVLLSATLAFLFSPAFFFLFYARHKPSVH